MYANNTDIKIEDDLNDIMEIDVSTDITNSYFRKRYLQKKTNYLFCRRFFFEVFKIKYQTKDVAVQLCT